MTEQKPLYIRCPSCKKQLLKISVNIDSAMPVEYRRSKTLQEAQHEFVLAALHANRGNRMQTAKDLNICIRTLRNMIISLKEHGFDVPKTEYIRAKGQREITIDTY